MTYFEAALQVLKSSQEPLTTREITERALERGLVVSPGKTPHRTMAAALYGRLSAGTQLVKIQTPGRTRAKRGTVRWTLREKLNGNLKRDSHGQVASSK
jgi:hypothetical protein